MREGAYVMISAALLPHYGTLVKKTSILVELIVSDIW